MQRRIAIPVLAAMLSVSVLQLHAADNDKKADKAPDAPSAPVDSTTEGTVTVGGQAIAYTAVAGTLTVGANPSQDSQLDLDGHWLPDSGVKTDKPDEVPPTARIFYVAYFKKGASNQTRPITFCYNGGPGSSTMWLHMGSFGPKRVSTMDTVHEAGAPYKIENNDFSLLDVSDLVFIDAPATGFSRV